MPRLEDARRWLAARLTWAYLAKARLPRSDEHPDCRYMLGLSAKRSAACAMLRMAQPTPLANTNPTTPASGPHRCHAR